MRIVVVGAGVIGIATAYELAMDGHAVTVFDKSAAACEEASFANGGLVAPSMLLPFAFPVETGNAFKRFLGTGLRMTRKPWRSLPEIKSLWRWTKNYGHDNRSERICSGQALGRFSAERLRHIVDTCQMELERSEGQLVLLRTEHALQLLQPTLEALKNQGIVCKTLSPEDARKQEPSLHVDTPFHAALWLPGDQVANCRQFALELKSITQKMGVNYQFGAEVQALGLQPQPSLTVAGIMGIEVVSADHVVLCTGLEPQHLLAKHPLNIPMVALHGYALSVALREPLNAPRSAVHDMHDDLTINRLGNRIRVSAGAELGPKPTIKDEKMVNTMYRALDRHFPGAANYPGGTQVWHGTRHAIVDGLPAIGKSGIPHLSLNIGHGACGWTWACGSARMLADHISGRPSVLATDPFLPTRFLR
jgi:D-amino-acid dehydrogenase